MTTLLDLFIKSVFVLGAAFTVNLAWRRASASERHLIWTLAFAALLLLPLTHLVAPRWTWQLPAVQTAFPSGKANAAVPTITPDASPTASRASLAWRAIVIAVWLVGVFGVLAFRGVGQLRLWRLYRRSQPLNNPRLAPKISWRHSPECAVPLTWGVWRPVVMLPSAALTWPEQYWNIVLRHELAHVERRDWLTRLVAHCLCAFYWPNPLVWLAARSLRLAQEQACDDAVLRSGTPADEYATLLCKVARLAGQGAVAMAQPSTLERRVRAVVDRQCNRRPLNRWTTLMGVLLVAGVVACSTTTQVATKEQDAADKAAKLIVPEVSFQDASLKQVVGFLTKRSRELDPEKRGVNIILSPVPGRQPPPVTLHLQNVPLLDAVKYVAASAGMKLVAEPDSLRLVSQ